MRVGLATILAGRRDHLRRQARAVGEIAGVHDYVAVAMDDEPLGVAGPRALTLPGAGGALPLAAARNRAIEALGDCELVILLDVDCIPGAELVPRYVAAARALAGGGAGDGGGGGGLQCGPVGYLDRLAGGSGSGPDAGARARARARVIRDFPATGLRRERRAELFWSLAFALSPATHARIGGFDESYVGYGAEDTDYGLRAARAGVGLWFVAGAWAYHQHHPPSAPRRPAELVANARRFHARWGFWPMADVLERLAAQGVIRWTAGGATCELSAPQARSAISSIGNAGPAASAGVPMK